MKMTVEKIRDMVKQDQKVKDSTSAEVEDLIKKMADLEKECQAAVDAGNVDAYYQKLQEKEKTAAALHVKKAFQEKINGILPVSEAAVREAWSGYVSGYNSKLDKQMAAFKAKRDELNAMYAAMVTLQNEACKTREYLAKAAGIPGEVKSFDMHKLSSMTRQPIEARFTNKSGAIKLDGFSCDDPDAVYYLACYEQENNIRFNSPSYDINTPAQKNERIRVQRVVARQEAFNDGD